MERNCAMQAPNEVGSAWGVLQARKPQQKVQPFRIRSSDFTGGDIIASRLLFRQRRYIPPDSTVSPPLKCRSTLDIVAVN